ncbi:hypothetical protein BGZ51_001459 [Haplosporangium sp. Z 767]|nr:hypothetical protein BGZ51_001459 [Haplosporangium sp. Z 767]
MSAPPRKLGTLVAIPIKGRKLLNRSGGKQSPYVQLKLSDQKKRTKASLIASVEPEWDQEVHLDVFHGMLDMYVSVYDDGKKNEFIGDGILLLHEVMDKGELDVWFPIKYKGAPAGDIYFELTFYAATPPPVVGGPPLPHHTQMHPPIRNSQPGFAPAGRPLPVYNNNYVPRPYAVPQPHTFPSPPPAGAFGGPQPARPGFHVPFGANTPTYRPATVYNGVSSPQGQHMSPMNSGIGIGSGPGPGMRPGINQSGSYPNHMPRPFPSQPSLPIRFPQSQHSSPGQRPGMPMQIPRPNGGNVGAGGYGQGMPGPRPHGGYPQGINIRPLASESVPPVTPLMQYNYTLGSFP